MFYGKKLSRAEKIASQMVSQMILRENKLSWMANYMISKRMFGKRSNSLYLMGLQFLKILDYLKELFENLLWGNELNQRQKRDESVTETD